MLELDIYFQNRNVKIYFHYIHLHLKTTFPNLVITILQFLKDLVYPKMKISPCFTHPESIGVYDFLLSDESNRSYIKNDPCSSKL